MRLVDGREGAFRAGVLPKVLVTGGAGYIGSHTVKALGSNGFELVTLDNLSMGHRWAVLAGEFVRGDLGDRELLRAVFSANDFAAVVHFAASAYVGESMKEPQKYFRNNVINTLNLLEVMSDHGVKKLVFSSTCATYGIPKQLPVGEAHPQEPLNPYGESKLFLERAIHWYAQTLGMRSVILRYFNAAGADPDGKLGEAHTPETHLIPLAIQAALGQRPYLEVYGEDYGTADGTPVRDYVHVSDLARAHALALEHLLDGGENLSLNLGTAHGYSVREVIDMVRRVSKGRVPLKKGPRRAGDPPELVADSRQAEAALGWRPQYTDIESIVETAWRWHATAAASPGLAAG